MRVLNRTAGRLSRHRRGPLAGLAVLLLGLLISGSLYTVFAPAQATSQASETEQVAQGKELFLASCAFCHGKNGEGVRTEDDTVIRPAADRGRRGRRSTSRSAPAACRWRARAAGSRKKVVFNDEEIAARRMSPRWRPAIPDESDYSLEGLSEQEREAAISRGGQIFLTNCAAFRNFNGSGGAMPRGGYARRCTASRASTSTRRC